MLFTYCSQLQQWKPDTAGAILRTVSALMLPEANTSFSVGDAVGSRSLSCLYGEKGQQLRLLSCCQIAITYQYYWAMVASSAVGLLQHRTSAGGNRGQEDPWSGHPHFAIAAASVTSRTVCTCTDCSHESA